MSKEKIEINLDDFVNIQYTVPITCDLPPIDSTRDGSNEANTTFQIHGKAITATTTRNGVRFLSEELQLAASSLQNKPLLKDHENTVDAIIGVVEGTQFVAINNDIPAHISFVARVEDVGMQEKIKKGLIKSVSIGARLDKNKSEVIEHEEFGQIVVARGIEFLELSLVAVPGDPAATISQAISEAFNLQQNTEIIMAEDETKEVTPAPAEDKKKEPAKEPEPASEESKEESDDTSEDADDAEEKTENFMAEEKKMKALLEENRVLKEEKRSQLVASYTSLVKQKGIAAVACESLDDTAITALTEQIKELPAKVEEVKVEEDTSTKGVVVDEPTEKEKVEDDGIAMTTYQSYVEFDRVDVTSRGDQ